jgi:penicillin-binding protein 2
MTVGALNNGFSRSTRLDCSSGFQVGSRLFHNYESESLGYIDFAKALQYSCDTFFYRVGFHFWQKYGSDPTNLHARDPLVSEAKAFGFGRPTGIDVPGESSGRIADRHWKLAYWKAMKGYYCGIDARNKTGLRDFLHLFAHEFCLEGSYYRAGDAVNFAIGQGDTLVTPLQLATAYGALEDDGRVCVPHVLDHVESSDETLVRRYHPNCGRSAHIDPKYLRYIRDGLKGTVSMPGATATAAFSGFPLSQVSVAGKTGTAQVPPKQDYSWFAAMTEANGERHVVVVLVEQGGHGATTAAPIARNIIEGLYGLPLTQFTDIAGTD